MEQRTPAVWTEQDQFAISERGAIKASGDYSGGQGRPCFLTVETAEHILKNLESFKQAVELARQRSMVKLVDRQLNKMQVQFIKMGLSPDQAAQAVQSVLKNPRTA